MASVTDTEMERLIVAGFLTGSLRDRQMEEQVSLGSTTESYSDRCRATVTTQFPR
jgi:hypothetical protein